MYWIFLNEFLLVMMIVLELNFQFLLLNFVHHMHELYLKEYSIHPMLMLNNLLLINYVLKATDKIKYYLKDFIYVKSPEIIQFDLY